MADYFVQKRENGDYQPSGETFQHVEATLQLLSVMQALKLTAQQAMDVLKIPAAEQPKYAAKL